MYFKSNYENKQFVCHKLCILWRFGCFGEFYDVQFREGDDRNFLLKEEKP